jgi:hypothetical protein
MICWHAWRAEIGLGLAAMIVGALMLLARASFESGLSLSLLPLAAAGALYPTVLIGVCPGASMPCRAGTLPALVILSSFLAALSLGRALFALRRGA